MNNPDKTQILIEETELVIITPEEKPTSNFTIKQFIGTKPVKPRIDPTHWWLGGHYEEGVYE